MMREVPLIHGCEYISIDTIFHYLEKQMPFEEVTRSKEENKEINKGLQMYWGANVIR